MKRYNNLYAKIYEKENLRLAAKEAAKNKGDYYGVAYFNKNADELLDKLAVMLKEKKYHTSPYKMRDIWEGKIRTLAILPYYPDNIVDHAIIQVIGDIITSTFTADTFSCIKGRGTSGCMRAVDKMIAETQNWEKLYIFKADVHHYFPSIDHEILKAIVRTKIKDPDLLWLLDEIIDSIEGAPIGRYFSQYSSNWYLTPFDHWVKEKLPAILRQRLGRDAGRFYYFRYMDDLTFSHKEKAVLHIIKDEVQRELTKYKLELKGNWQIFPVAENRADKSGRGLDFVGFVWFRRQKLLRSTIKLNFAKKIRGLKYVTKQQIASYIGWVKYSNSKHLFLTLTNNSYYDFTQRHKASRFRENWRRPPALPLRHSGGADTASRGG